MSAELQEFDSYDHFKRLVPRNSNDWDGSVVMYSTVNGTFFNIAFGEGGNLDDHDLDQGFNDYIMVEQYGLDGSKSLGEVMDAVKHAGYIDEYTDGTREIDGGQLLLRRKEWSNGDIRRFIMEAMDFAGYGLPKGTPKELFHVDAIYVCADYDYIKEDTEE